MKIMDIILEQNENDKMVQLENLLSEMVRNLWYKKDINLTSGTGYISYRLSSKRELEVFIVYMPDHVNPIIPTDLIKIASDEVISAICLARNMSKDEMIEYYGVFLEHIRIHIEKITISLMEGIIFLKDYMDNNTYNVKIERPNSFSELFQKDNVYLLLPEELPKFSDDYASTMSKLIKKCKTIYTALGKGTWKGHTYDYGKFMVGHVTVHQRNRNYNKKDKILRPDFEITHNPGYVWIDGVKSTRESSPLTKEEMDEFTGWLRNKFKHFGIDFAA